MPLYVLHVLRPLTLWFQGGQQMGAAKGANLLPGNGQMRMKQMSESIGIVTYAPP